MGKHEVVDIFWLRSPFVQLAYWDRDVKGQRTLNQLYKCQNCNNCNNNYIDCYFINTNKYIQPNLYKIDYSLET